MVTRGKKKISGEGEEERVTFIITLLYNEDRGSP